MPYEFCRLPEYPCKRDMWDELRDIKKPVVVYGMGNGADKLFARLEKYGVEVADVFASDGFVRGHSFRGYKVLSFGEIKEKYDDFVILLSFATSREEVIAMLEQIDREYDMYVPDMPVADAEEYFDREFYNANYGSIKEAYDALRDESSRNCFASVVSYKLSGRMKYLLGAYSEKEEIYATLGRDVERYIDCGAYNGDTLSEALRFFPSLKSAVALEPDPKTYKRLLKYVGAIADEYPEREIKTVMAAAWSEEGGGVFQSSSNRNSSVGSTASHEMRTRDVELITVDSLDFHADYVKYDVEGAELEALFGSHETIEKYRPALLVSVYHKSRDIFSLLCYLKERYPFYDFEIRRTRCVPAWEVDLLALPRRELETGAPDITKENQRKA